MYDLVLHGALVVDPGNSFHQVADVAVTGEKIAAVAAGLPAGRACRVLDVSGRTVIPGIIDPHVHLASWIGGPEGYAMLARAGVTTAVDFSGPVEEILDSSPEHGCGLNIAVLDALLPGKNLSGSDPGQTELARFIDRALKQGALGIKILGGHPAHLVHLNSYCRGLTAEPLQEFRDLAALLEGKRNIVRESYLARINGTSGACRGGEVASEVTRNCLGTGGYAPTRGGAKGCHPGGLGPGARPAGKRDRAGGAR